MGRIEVYKRGRQTAEGITDLTYRMDRHYDEVGNIELLTVDRNGDGLYTGSGERNESRVFNDANEMVSRTQPNGSVTTTEYSANGELVKGADARERIYDAWGNLVRVEKDNGGQPMLILRRDGPNRVIMQHAKPNGEGGLIHSSNPVLYYLPDGSGRPLAVFEADEVNPVVERRFHGPDASGCSYPDTSTLRRSGVPAFPMGLPMGFAGGPDCRKVPASTSLGRLARILMDKECPDFGRMGQGSEGSRPE